jgi:uncharacterized membrane protein YhaH (DUF805 family)
MDFVQLFTSMEGRIPRSRFWIAVLIFIVVSIIVWLVLSPILGVGMFASMAAIGSNGTPDVDVMMQMMQRSAWLSLVIFVIFVWPGAAVMIKRRHDRGSSGIEVWVFYGLEALSILIQAFGFGYSMQDIGGTQVPMPSMIMMILGVIMLIYSLYLLVVCGFLRGDSGANAYGPDPLGGN